jgi:hypothetical protein
MVVAPDPPRAGGVFPMLIFLYDFRHQRCRGEARGAVGTADEMTVYEIPGHSGAKRCGGALHAL